VTVQAKLQERGAIAVELALLSSLQMNTRRRERQHYAELVREKASNDVLSRSLVRSSMTPTSPPKTSWD